MGTINKTSSLVCAVLTVSDTRTKKTDKSGKRIIDELENSGHKVVSYQLIPDDRKKIAEEVQKLTMDESFQVVVITGGTGISKRDVTIEALEPLLDKEVPGFGELFRFLSFRDDIGTKSMLSRALCGVINRCLVFALPGSAGAVKLAMEQLIIPEIHHMVHETNKDLLKKRKKNC